MMMMMKMKTRKKKMKKKKKFSFVHRLRGIIEKFILMTIVAIVTTTTSLKAHHCDNHGFG